MKSIRVVSVILGLGLTPVALAGDKRGRQQAELETIKAELKPLRERANLEADVIVSRKALDAAYRAYWESVRVAMARLEPKKKALINREIALRKQLSSVRGEQPSPEKKPKKSTEPSAAQ